MRLFVGLALPDDLRGPLGEMIDRLALVGDPVKWVDERNLHLTLKFLGEADEPRLGEIRAAVDRAVAGTGPLELSLKGAGAYPSPKHPRTFWAGVVAPAGLAPLAARVAKETEALGFEPEKRDWSPHVTIGRAREGHQRRRPRKGRAPAEAVTSRMADAIAQEAAFAAGPVRIEAVTLFRSQLSKTGPIYTAVHEAPLKG